MLKKENSLLFFFFLSFSLTKRGDEEKKLSFFFSFKLLYTYRWYILAQEGRKREPKIAYREVYCNWLSPLLLVATGMSGIYIYTVIRVKRSRWGFEHSIDNLQVLHNLYQGRLQTTKVLFAWKRFQDNLDIFFLFSLFLPCAQSPLLFI